MSSSSSESEPDQLDLGEDKEWEDAESDIEKLEYRSLFDDERFTTLPDFLLRCKNTHNFDLLDIIKTHDLDFLDTVRLINYVRSEHRAGRTITTASLKKDDFQDDQFMQPVLPDDALLFSIDDLLELANGQDQPVAGADEESGKIKDSSFSAPELELQQVKDQFAQYRAMVSETLDARWADSSKSSDAPATKTTAPAGPSRLQDSTSQVRHWATTQKPEDESSYFSSYSGSDIHELMLKDEIRTDSYRNFIYTYKSVFTGKTVLDIGCGTGILSLFCAKAGAKRVIAIDASPIIHKAAAIAHLNGFGTDKISFLHGRIEETPLPLAEGEKVDVIVSEWMGYCLLFEAMFDSVLWARDRYLNPDTGIMVPSHASIRLAPVEDQAFVADSVNWWRSVYGFDMGTMLEGVYDDVIVRRVEPQNVVGGSSVVKWFDLHTVTTKDLEFEGNFKVALNKDIDELDAWLVWFDIFFATSRDMKIPADAKAEDIGNTSEDGLLAFTTGPGGKDTHWHAGMLLVNAEKEDDTRERKSGTEYSGRTTFKKGKENQRNLVIKVEWNDMSTQKTKNQEWAVR